jgi:hypothetical protein
MVTSVLEKHATSIFRVHALHKNMRCDVQLESWNLRIRRAELREARSHGNTKYTVSLGFDGAFGGISMVMTF